MKNIIINILGWISFVVVIVMNLPQAIKVLIKKDTKSLLKITIFLIFSNSIIWFIYGILTNQNQIYIANIISSIFSFSIICFIIFNKIKHNKKLKK